MQCRLKSIMWLYTNLLLYGDSKIWMTSTKKNYQYVLNSPKQNDSYYSELHNYLHALLFIFIFKYIFCILYICINMPHSKVLKASIEVLCVFYCYKCTFVRLVVSFRVLWIGCLCSSTLDPYPRPSASISSALGPKNIARLNTIILLNFEVVTTLKL